VGLRAVAMMVWPCAKMCLAKAAPRPDEQPVTVVVLVGERGFDHVIRLPNQTESVVRFAASDIL
jgi:hypothetical protein